MESRKASPGRWSPLPLDYLKMVSEVFATNFDEGLRAFAKVGRGKPRFEASGKIFINEIQLCISLLREGQLSATSVYASCDYDPRASAPTIEELLAACVDAAGSLFQQLLVPGDKKRLEQLADESLSSLDKVPFDWTLIQIEKHKIYLKIDKANPSLDQLTDEWLAKNDPQLKRRAQDEEEATQDRFFTGPKNVGTKKPGDDDLH
ncbi:MAG: hypothetical protein NDJ90_00285 [Oligoflexia bacterium]|nr:hypothetical protein [Oligoflexia bacterium]